MHPEATARSTALRAATLEATGPKGIVAPRPSPARDVARATDPSSGSMGREWVMRVEDLAIGYGRHPLFRGLSFEVPQGDILGIVGPNGCGKTTLLRTMLGLLEPISGCVRRQSGVNISYVPQRERTERIIPVTALEVVLMGLGARTRALQRIGRTERDAAAHALALLGIEPLARTLFRNLSTGQQQRVLLARALVIDPHVLVLDEPTFGMDVGGEAVMLDFLQDLNRRCRVTIIIVTHHLPIVLNLASAVVLMSAGAILQGTVDEVLREDRLTALYGVPICLGSLAGQRTLVVERDRTCDV